MDQSHPVSDRDAPAEGRDVPATDHGAAVVDRERLPGSHDALANERDAVTLALKACTTRLDEIETTNRWLRLLVLGGTVCLATLAGLFGWSLWNTLQRQLAPEKLETAMTAKLQAIGPPLGQRFADEVMAAVPTYSELAMKRGEKAWPVFAARIATEADSFAAGTEAMVRQRADKAVERVAARLSADLKRDYPKLTDERCEFLAKRLRDGLMTEGAGLGEEVQATIGRERLRLEALLDKLPVEAAALEPESRLQKRFMRNVLQMVDAAVAEWPTEEDAAAPAAGIMRTTPVAGDSATDVAPTSPSETPSDGSADASAPVAERAATPPLEATTAGPDEDAAAAPAAAPVAPVQ